MRRSRKQQHQSPSSNHTDTRSNAASVQDGQGEASLSRELEPSITAIQQLMGNSADLKIRRFHISEAHVLGAVLYVDGLIDKQILTTHIIEPLLDKQELSIDQGIDALLHEAQYNALTASHTSTVTSIKDAIIALLSGQAFIMFDGCSQGVLADTRGGKEREVTEPATQTVLRGPRDSFTESICTNTALIRRKIKDANLWSRAWVIGDVTKTNVILMHMNGIADNQLLDEVSRRLDHIQIDGILESGYIEELIEGRTFTPFPTIQNTDRPDAAAAALLEGRMVILIDGTPFVLIVPALFVQFFQASEDYYQRWDISTLIRLLRFLAFTIAMLGPSVYIAVTTFHHELIPTPLLISLAAQREGVPVPAFIEALIMETMFEVLREAGVRMGRAIGTSISIVGTLVIGQAAVEAGLVTAGMVIVVSATAIANFVAPSFNMGISTRILRFALMGLAASFGLYGITLGIILITLHLCNLRSFGIPFMSALAPYQGQDQQDVFLRLPRWLMLKRPQSIPNRNHVREDKQTLSEHVKGQGDST